ncbi:MAG: 23S rRNA (adenine(2503)-C(2))-methyltransferase RlmN [Synergistaceae bacterium]|nr:23S rRNA (adenine(2503)-C(2))-methyltransferase RlmN [Synergistaceae bacterium]
MNVIHDALSLSYEGWNKLLIGELELPRFRADQICQWIYQKKVFDYAEMTNLSKELREKLRELFTIIPPMIIKEQVSRDGTQKFLLQLTDGEKIESVLIHHGNHSTACISSQVGCQLGCSFCATGITGFSRSLSVSEIVGQFLVMEKRFGKDINNVVFMGMGEPFCNTDNVFSGILALNNPKMRNLGARHISISTSGVVPGIIDLSNFEVPVRLSVSLHAPNDALRSKLMPVNRKYSLESLMDALKIYQERAGERITFEYIMIDKVNDSVGEAYELATLLNGIGAYVNIIPYNPVIEKYERSSDARIKEFCSVLSKLHIEFEVRHEKGTDIDAACGQLRKTMHND